MQEAFSRTERESSVAVFLSTRKEYCPFLCFPHSSINSGVSFLPHLVTRSHLIYFQQLGIGLWPLNSHFHNVWRWWHCSRLLQVPLQQHTPSHLLRERIVSIFSENYFICYTGSNTKLWNTEAQPCGFLGLTGTKPSISRGSRPHTNSMLWNCTPSFIIWEILLRACWGTHKKEGHWSAKPHLPPTLCTGSSVCRTTKAAAP